MKKSIAFALAMTLIGVIHAAPQSKVAPHVSTTNKTLPNAVPAAQTGSPSVAPVQTGAGNAAAPNGNSNMVCPPGIKPQQNGTNNGKCFPRPTKSVQR